MHVTLDSWRPHRDPERFKQEPDVLYSDLSEDDLVGDDEEDLVQITEMSSKGGSSLKGEPKMVRASKRCFYDLQVLE